MIFGDPARFAISLNLDADYGGAWLFGKLCYWIGSQKIGDWDLGTSLRDALWGFTSITRDNGHREDCSLFDAAADLAFEKCDVSLYGRSQPIADNFVENAAVFNILPPIDVFDNWKAYLIECKGQARLLYKGPQPSVQEIMLPQGEFDAAVQAVHAELNTLYEREISIGQ